MQVVVEYGGATTRPEDIEGALYGWVTTRDGAMVVGEPEGSMTWYPVSDHQTDKASYELRDHGARGQGRRGQRRAVARPRRPPTGWTTWYWDAPDQQASYLTTASVGDFDLRDDVHISTSGVPIIDAVDANLTPARLATTNASLARQVEMIDFFESTTSAATRSSRSGRSSTTTPSATHSRRRPARSTPARRARAPSRTNSPTSGSATRSAPSAGRTSGSTRAGRRTRPGCGTKTTAARPCRSRTTTGTRPRSADSEYWDLQIGDPGALGLFQDPVYDRGAGTLHALRLELGDDAVLRRHPALARALRRLGRHGRGLPGGLRGGLGRGPRRLLPDLAVRPGEAAGHLDPAAVGGRPHPLSAPA